MSLRVLSSRRANVWKSVFELVRNFWTIQNACMLMQIILILSGSKILATTALGGAEWTSDFSQFFSTLARRR